MRRAFELGASHHTHPNPRVGAVVVDGSGSVVGEGAHAGAGQPHAEVIALERAGPGAEGATLFVSLEPCNHEGRTPPCVPVIIGARIAKVVVGTIDPDPRVSGSGVSALQSAGVEVVTGMLSDEAEAVDPAYFKQRRTGLPRVTLKMAMTMDGSVAALDGTSQWITGEEARHDAHQLRSSMDAIIVGSGTMISDDPQLTVRLDGPRARQPRPVIVAGERDLPADRRLWERSPLVVSTRPMDIPSGELALVGPGGGLPDPIESARALADRGLLDVMIEGGPRLAGSWWRSGVVDRGVFYIAARVGGGRGFPALAGEFATMAQSKPVRIEEARMVGPDVRIEFE
jgi:diaminohydroxyphosphoribosylaminopyrimidine deaminase/5-amino-6-(5-phosphoribosylamino)uracil reductase